MSRNKSLICQCTRLFFVKFRLDPFGRDMKFGRKGSSIESKSILSTSRSLSLRSKLSLVSAYARVITVERVGKGTVASVLESARGATRCREGPAFVPRRAEGYVGNAGDSLSDIRYSHRALFLRRPPSAPYRAPRRDPLPHDSRMCFVCTTACNVWAPALFIIRPRPPIANGMYVAFSRARRSLRRLIMVILSRRCKLRRSRARRAVTRGPRSGCFEKRSAQTDYCNNCETIAFTSVA